MKRDFQGRRCSDVQNYTEQSLSKPIMAPILKQLTYHDSYLGDVGENEWGQLIRTVCQNR